MTYIKKFYEVHPEKKTESIICDCGGSYKYFNRSKHNKTKEHIKYLKIKDDKLLLNKDELNKDELIKMIKDDNFNQDEINQMKNIIDNFKNKV